MAHLHGNILINSVSIKANKLLEWDQKRYQKVKSVQPQRKELTRRSQQGKPRSSVALDRKSDRFGKKMTG